MIAELLSMDSLTNWRGNADKPLVKSRLKLVPGSMRLSLISADIAALLIASFAAQWLTHWLQVQFLGGAAAPVEYAGLARANIYLALCFGVIAALWNKGAYSVRMPWWSQVQAIGKIVILAFLVDGFISFAMKIPSSRLLIAANWVVAFGLLLTARFLVLRFASRVQQWNIPAVIMAGNDTTTDLLMAFHNDPGCGYDVHTAFLRDRDWKQFDVIGLPAEYKKIQLRNGLDDGVSFVLENPDNFYIISMDAYRGEMRDQLLRALDRINAHYALVPSLSLSGFHGTMPQYYFGHDVMLMPAEATNRRRISLGRITKRAMDIFISGLALLVLSPLFLLVAAMLKIEGQGGSVFYGGKRLGKKGKLFKCWKFRSMEPDSDHLLEAYLEADPLVKARWEKYRKLEQDPRITTKTAHIIRKLSIDELPQLWNVLVGDMSIVGPRPILEEETHYFGRRIRHYLSVRPGLTGLWQVSGRNNTSFMRRVYWDSWYVRNWSLWHDIIIMIKTPLVLISRKGAY